MYDLGVSAGGSLELGDHPLFKSTQVHLKVIGLEVLLMSFIIYLF